MQTLDAFDRQFPTDDACKAYLAEKRWPNGVRCPRCGAGTRIYASKARPFHWICKNVDCGERNGYRFSVITWTIFENTKIPLKTWFKVGYLMLTAKKGISALQIHRVIFGEDSGSDWRTSWYMCHRWRAAMRGDAFPLEGVVEVDETYVGGKDRNRHKNKKSHVARAAAGQQRPGHAVGYKKVGVIGAISRKGNVVAAVIGDMSARTKSDFVREVVSESVSLVATDQDHAFNYVRKGMPHESVDHSKGEYVRGRVHTNNIESFWSLLKRGIMGSFRHNHREDADMFGTLVTTCSS